MKAACFISALKRQRRMGLWVWGQPGQPSDFQAIEGYVVKPYLKTRLVNESLKIWITTVPGVDGKWQIFICSVL